MFFIFFSETCKIKPTCLSHIEMLLFWDSMTLTLSETFNGFQVVFSVFSI